MHPSFAEPIHALRCDQCGKCFTTFVRQIALTRAQRFHIRRILDRRAQCLESVVAQCTPIEAQMLDRMVLRQSLQQQMCVVAEQWQTFQCQTGQRLRRTQTLWDATDEAREQDFRSDWHLTREFPQFIQRIYVCDGHLKCSSQFDRNVQQTVVVRKSIDDCQAIVYIDAIATDFEILLLTFLGQRQWTHHFWFAVFDVFLIEIVFPVVPVLAFVTLHGACRIEWEREGRVYCNLAWIAWRLTLLWMEMPSLLSSGNCIRYFGMYWRHHNPQ